MSDDQQSHDHGRIEHRATCPTTLVLDTFIHLHFIAAQLTEMNVNTKGGVESLHVDITRTDHGSSVHPNRKQQ